MSQAILFRPVFSNILRNRRLGSAICAAALLQLLLTLFGLPGWPCPIFHTLGIPCPGCGLTRATLYLFHGDFKQSLMMHAFAPIFVTALAVITFCTVGPRNHTERIAAGAETLEHYTGLTVVLLSGLILYWLARLVILQTAFVRLIQ